MNKIIEGGIIKYTKTIFYVVNQVEYNQEHLNNEDVTFISGCDVQGHSKTFFLLKTLDKFG